MYQVRSHRKNHHHGTFCGQASDKPNSVPLKPVQRGGNHLSLWNTVLRFSHNHATYPSRKRERRAHLDTRSGSISLAADGVYLLILSPAQAGRSYRPLFTLTGQKSGGIVSVALSLRLPWVAVSNHPVLELFGLSSPKRSDCLLACNNILPDLYYLSSMFNAGHPNIRLPLYRQFYFPHVKRV